MDEFDASEVFDIIDGMGSEEWRHVDSEAEKFLGKIG